jgi:penicillin-insensitive murein endopeptidase
VAFTEAGVALFHLLRQLESSLPHLAPLPVSKGRMALLRSLALRGPRNLSELARERGVSRQGVQRLADKAPTTGWHGLLVGDMSQPRGGPMRTGHASHQVGLDADIWLTPMPNRELTRQEREEMSATMNGVAVS